MGLLIRAYENGQPKRTLCEFCRVSGVNRPDGKMDYWVQDSLTGTISKFDAATGLELPADEVTMARWCERNVSRRLDLYVLALSSHSPDLQLPVADGSSECINLDRPEALTGPDASLRVGLDFKTKPTAEFARAILNALRAWEQRHPGFNIGISDILAAPGTVAARTADTSRTRRRPNR